MLISKRVSIALPIAATLSLLVGCDKARELYTEFTTTPEQRIQSRSCGGSNTEQSVLGVTIGMGLNEAIAILRCYDSKATLEQGTSGSNASDVNKYLREKTAGSSGYSNMFVWTRGARRNCTATSEEASSLSDSLRPDDTKFSPWVFTGGKTGSGFACFAKVSEQIAFLADGAPGQQVVSGIWRTSVPSDGNRPSLDSTFDGFASRFSALDAQGANRTAQGFIAEGYLDATGRKIAGPQIRSDYASLTAPTSPTPPKTTESCGFLWMKTCDRTPTPQENAAFAAATEQYNQQMKEFKERRPIADAYYSCVKSPPSTPIERPISVEDKNKCGSSYFFAAKGYPGGVVEAFFIGIYSHQHAKSGALQLSEYLKQFRGSTDEAQKKPTL